ncbi:MAG: hypothetical protein MZV63_15925, partial [Marinilabiliales bacterium]|nr:hypothetical protein [Marinilabiliales bacterium]
YFVQLRIAKVNLVTGTGTPAPGEGGAKLHRRTCGELVENVAGSGEYHWMAGNFIKYAGPLTADDLPVDAHELIALCAPRPVFISSGSFEVEGGWVDAKGMFLGAGRRRSRSTGSSARQGPGDDGVPADRDRAGRRRHRVPPAPRRPHGRAELADVHRVCREVLRRREVR